MKKKTYQKPHMLFENFVLMDMISAGCSVKLNQADVNTCTAGDSGDPEDTIFSSDVCSWQMSWDDYESYFGPGKVPSVS